VHGSLRKILRQELLINEFYYYHCIPITNAIEFEGLPDHYEYYYDAKYCGTQEYSWYKAYYPYYSTATLESKSLISCLSNVEVENSRDLQLVWLATL